MKQYWVSTAELSLGLQGLSNWSFCNQINQSHSYFIIWNSDIWPCSDYFSKTVPQRFHTAFVTSPHSQDFIMKCKQQPLIKECVVLWGFISCRFMACFVYFWLFDNILTIRKSFEKDKFALKNSFVALHGRNTEQWLRQTDLLMLSNVLLENDT